MPPTPRIGTIFAGYRIVLGLIVIVLAATNVIT